MSERKEINREALAIERARRSAPTTVALAETLFDGALALASPMIEEIAILVDGDAQRGIEYTHDDIRRVLDRVRKIIGD